MNSLSWLLYAADVVPGLASAFKIVGALGTIASAPLIISGIVPWDRYEGYSDEYWASQMAFRKVLGRSGFVMISVCSLLFFAGSAVPSTRTFYMIAASEAGEAVVTSPDAIEMMGDLKAIIKKRLKDELGE